MTKDKEGPYVRPPQMLAEILRALLTFREKLAAQLLTFSIDLAPPHVSTQVREVLLCLCTYNAMLGVGAAPLLSTPSFM